MSFLAPTTYTAPPRLGRGRPLKTISEYEECNFGLKSDSEGDDSDRTIIARPAGLDARLAAAKCGLSGASNSTASSPVASSPCSEGSSIDESIQQQGGRFSLTDSDAGTVFSEDCPSLAGSNDTTFYTNSSRNSTSSDQSGRATRNRYPGILIPRDSWIGENIIKEVTLGMSPAQKILLSPQALSALPQNVPALHAPPSFGDRSSIASNSPAILAISSAPVTPDHQNNIPAPGAAWGAGAAAEDALPLQTPIEIAIDEHHSILVSPREPQYPSERGSTDYSTDWSDIVVRFPRIPGATPQETTPVEHDLSDLRGFNVQPSEHGVQLPTDAMKLLHNLTRSYSPDSISHQSGTSRAKQEMRERSDAGSRPRSASAVPETPTFSDYSFSQLSIPSPGGFFSSLQASSRATWCFPAQSRAPSMPSSAVAENFYELPWGRTSTTIETILEVPDRELTDGPPTARQTELGVPDEYRADSEEDDDLYGSHESVQVPAPQMSPGMRYEYDDAYEDGLKQAAEVNIDRTGDWLSAQTSYMSALRESNPMNDPADYIPQTPHPLNDSPIDNGESPARKAVRFLEEAINVSENTVTKKQIIADIEPRDRVFLQAFENCCSQKGRKDTFLQGTSRLESVNNSRLTMPLRHVHTLLNTHTTETLQAHNRPKYRGPFGQNPRATGNFQKTPEQILFAEAERKQRAVEHILPTMWSIEAQRQVLHKGHLFACPAAVTRLASESSRPRRVLDLAGAATGSWAWLAARKWANAEVVTVQTRNQTLLASQCMCTATGSTAPIKAEGPSNHKVITVPALWKLPFKDNSFDVVTARTLHMFLRSRPVPEVVSINEWDLTLKECMRVLKPGGILDFVLLDSKIVNNNSENKSKHSRDNSEEATASISPTAAYGQGLTSPPPTATFAATTSLLNPPKINFGRDLSKNGYDADGGCSKIAQRLEDAGFTNVKRQWIGLPLGRTGATHDNVAASYEIFDAAAAAESKTKDAQAGLQRSKIGSVNHANGRSRTPFPPAPRPISEVSTISRILEQYSNVEAVHGPVGSTAEVSDIAGLLGTMMWEEWLVRHRLEVLNGRSNIKRRDNTEAVDPNFEATNLLYGINDVLAAGYDKGACFRAVVGWARKPRRTAPSQPQPQPQPQPKPQAKPRSRPRLQMAQQHVPFTIKTSPSTSQSHRESSYHNRAARLARSNPIFDGYPPDETPTTASTMTPLAHQYYARSSRLQFHTPIEQVRQDLTLDTRGLDLGSHGSPQFTESAVERGEVGTIPMMIVG
ncbi:hypothetical protein LTS08_004221 [Lithohypha guttulata]|nr:hypothetical protein LTS08_004221 [Lithohypha guttulata]